MSETFREVSGTLLGAAAAFIGYKLAYAAFGFVSNDILRLVFAGIPGAVVGVGAMYLTARREKARP